MSDSIDLGFKVKEVSLMSAKMGVAFAFIIALADATHVKLGTMIYPRISAHSMANCRAEVQEFIDIA